MRDGTLSGAKVSLGQSCPLLTKQLEKRVVAVVQVNPKLAVRLCPVCVAHTFELLVCTGSSVLAELPLGRQCVCQYVAQPKAWSSTGGVVRSENLGCGRTDSVTISSIKWSSLQSRSMTLMASMRTWMY